MVTMFSLQLFAGLQTSEVCRVSSRLCPMLSNFTFAGGEVNRKVKVNKISAPRPQSDCCRRSANHASIYSSDLADSYISFTLLLMPTAVVIYIT